MPKINIAILTTAIVFSVFANAKNRPFNMGIITWPYGNQENQVNTTYDKISQNADMISYHLEDGVPWSEAYYGVPYPSQFVGEWDFAKSKWERAKSAYPSKNYKTYLAVTPLSRLRDGIAEYAKGSTLLGADFWKIQPLNSSYVKQAYCNYVVTAASAFNPDYLAIGIEVNVYLTKTLLLTKSLDNWIAYKDLQKSTYTCIKDQLRAKNPNIKILVTFSYSHLQGAASGSDSIKQMDEISSLNDSMDIVGLSIYPYGFDYPANYVPDSSFFNPAINLSKNMADANGVPKVLAVSEGGMASHPYRAFNVDYIYNERIQKKYYNLLLKTATNAKFEFVNNWEGIDAHTIADQLYPLADRKNNQWYYDFAITFGYIGLYSESNDVLTPKLAMKVWQRYLLRPLVR